MLLFQNVNVLLSFAQPSPRGGNKKTPETRHEAQASADTGAQPVVRETAAHAVRQSGRGRLANTQVSDTPPHTCSHPASANSTDRSVAVITRFAFRLECARDDVSNVTRETAQDQTRTRIREHLINYYYHINANVLCLIQFSKPFDAVLKI